MKSTGVIICNYNKADFVINCIQSVLESKTDDYDIFVVDNASTDDSVARIRQLYDNWVTLIINPENMGGSGGFNTGIRKVVELGYKYVWCLDNDVIVDEHALDTLVSFMDEHPQVGMTGSKVVHMENPDIIQQFGLLIDFEQFGTVARYLNQYNSPELPKVVYSDAVAACSVLVRSSLIKIIGLMPEENFLYWDDTEWGLLCNLAGYKVASLGTSVVAHAMGAKKENENTFATYYTYRNWFTFFLKYLAEDCMDAFFDFFSRTIFDAVYGGLYRKEENRSKTIMFAYNDALNRQLGKASPSKIFPIDKNLAPIKELASRCNEFIINVSGDYVTEAGWFAESLKTYNPDAQIHIVTENDKMSVPKNCMVQFCANIFRLKETEINSAFAYADINDNILLPGGDISLILSYETAYQAFRASQKPLFMQCAREIQEEFTIPFTPAF